MKSLFSLLLKIGIPAVLLWLLMASNPGLGKHEAAIVRKVSAVEAKKIQSPTTRRVAAAPTTEDSPYTYHDYFVVSKTTDADGEMSSTGFVDGSL